MASFSFKSQCINYFSVIFLFVGLAYQLADCRHLSDEQQSVADIHEEWMAQFGRVYHDSTEKSKRLEIFSNNMKFIQDFNAGMERGYKLGVNKFTDLTNEEFAATYNGYKGKSDQSITPSKRIMPFRYGNVTDVPDSVDWRKKGAVTPVKDQQQCGCCWAFSTVASVEGAVQIATGQLTSLSEQELVDCNKENNGCQGGLMKYAFEYVKEQGLVTEDAYPYTAEDGTCNTNNDESATTTHISGYGEVPAEDENALLQAVTKQPVSVAINGDGAEFKQYSSGVFNGPCGSDLNHAVTLVGFGSTRDGTKYWILKNSWGTSWGENGYMRIARGVDDDQNQGGGGVCGLARDASYPIA